MVKPPTITRRGLTEDEKRAHAITLNLQRRQLDWEAQRSLAAELVKVAPERSDRQIAEAAGVSHPSVAKIRRELEADGDVETVSTRIDTKGRTYPATKPAPVIDFPGAQTARQANSMRGRRSSRRFSDGNPTFAVTCRRSGSRLKYAYWWYTTSDT